MVSLISWTCLVSGSMLGDTALSACSSIEVASVGIDGTESGFASAPRVGIILWTKPSSVVANSLVRCPSFVKKSASFSFRTNSIFSEVGRLLFGADDLLFGGFVVPE